MNYQNAQYSEFDYGGDIGVVTTSINIEKDGIIIHVPIDPANSDYAEIMRQVEAGDLTIEDAD